MSSQTLLRERELSNLLKRMASGDRAAYGLLFERERSALETFFIRLCRCPSRSDDLVQNTFVTLWRYRDNFTARGKATSYLYRVALNQWRQWCRQENRRHDVHRDFECTVPPRVVPAPDREAERDDLKEWVWHSITQLKPPQREVFVLHRFEGLSCPEIAEVLDENLKTVESRLRLALSKLTRSLSARRAGSGREGA